MHNVLQWIGTPESFDPYLALMRFQNNHEVITEGVQSLYTRYVEDDSEEEFRPGIPLVSFRGNIAVVTISGSLVPNYSVYNSWFGLVSYEEIRDAMLYATERHGIEKMLLRIDSGGGAVTGLDECAHFIKEIDRNVMPVHAYTGSLMCSGAYWLAASCRTISAAKMALVGSIGVIAVHFSYARLLKENGIDAKVFRAGRFKALGHPAEKLSSDAIQNIEKTLSETYDYFLKHVSLNRRIKLDEKDKWAEGKVFYAENVIKLGLVDKIQYLSDSVEKLISTDDNRSLITSVSNQSQGSDDMSAEKKLVSSEQDLAALQSGARVESVDENEETTTQETESGNDNPEVNNPDTSEDTSEDNPETSSEPQPSAKAESQSVVNGVDPKLYAEAVAEKAVMERDLKDLTAKYETAQSDVESLKSVAIVATNRLQIALNQAPMAMEGLSASVVLETYKATEKKFQETYKVGAQAKTVTEHNADQPQESGIFPVE